MDLKRILVLGCLCLSFVFAKGCVSNEGSMDTGDSGVDTVRLLTNVRILTASIHVFDPLSKN